MLSPLTIETITTQTDVFYCDCRSDCVDSVRLPVLVVELLMNDPSLMLLIINHKSDKAGEVIRRGKGWKVCRVKGVG